MLRVVIDTSTLVSFALTSGDITRQIISAWQNEEFLVLTTLAMRQELRRVLERPRLRARMEEPLTWLANAMDQITVHVPGNLVVTGACRDPKDDMFLACAVEGQAHYIVSSDRDLLDMRRFQDVCILNPGQFLAALQLSRLSAEEIKRQYSHSGLQRVHSALCLDADTATKVRQVLAGYHE